MIDAHSRGLKLKIIPSFKDLLPPLGAESRLELETSLLANGCRDPIITWAGVIVDGHNRYEICNRQGIEYETTEMEFNSRLEAKLWIISNQVGRRNMTVTERAAMAAKYEELLGKQRKGETGAWKAGDPDADGLKAESDLLEQNAGSAEHKKAMAELSKTLGREVFVGEDDGLKQEKQPRSRKIAAEKFGVSEESIAKHKYIEKHGDSALKAEVKAGTKSLNAAHKELKERVDAEKDAQNQTKSFNRTNDNISWAAHSWNPYTGCLGPAGDGVLCDYCYAKEMNDRFKMGRFLPVLHAQRLHAPFHTRIPEHDKQLPGIHNVFLVSMGDLAHAERGYLKEILKVVRSCENNPDIPPWRFIVLTKVPEWLPTVEWPSNCFVGVTVDVQKRVAPAIKALSETKATVKIISVEPMLEPISFITGDTVGGLENDVKLGAIKAGKDWVNGLAYIDWLIIGARSKTKNLPEFQPEWKWVERVLAQARQAEVAVYMKPNLTARAKEYPIVD